MNKNTVNAEMEIAYRVLQEQKIAAVNRHTGRLEIDKTFRGLISSFGAMIVTRSLVPAVYVFSRRGSAAVDRSALTDAILSVLKQDGRVSKEVETLYDYVTMADEQEAKENILNASLALKIAMNLYVLADNKETTGKEKA